MTQVTVDQDASRLVVAAPASTVSIQELIDAVRDLLEPSSILVWSSDQDLGGDVHVFPRAVLQGAWRVCFAGAPENPEVVGGFLTVADGSPAIVDPITGEPIAGASVWTTNANPFARHAGRVFF